MSQLFESDGQSIGALASALVLPMSIQGWFRLGLTGLISLQSKRLSRIFSSTTVQKHECMEPEANLWKIPPNPVSHKKLFKGFHEFDAVQKFYIALPKTSCKVERIFPWLSITTGRKKSINHAVRKIKLSFSYMYKSLIFIFVKFYFL